MIRNCGSSPASIGCMRSSDWQNEWIVCERSPSMRSSCLRHASRYRSRWKFFSEFLTSDDADETIDFEAPDHLEEGLAQADRQALVEQALQKLPAAQRVPLVLFHLEGLQYDEIAAKLNISLGKVKTDIFRARKTLRKSLEMLAGELNGLLRVRIAFAMLGGILLPIIALAESAGGSVIHPAVALVVLAFGLALLLGARSGGA